jgi:outer membrane protein
MKMKISYPLLVPVLFATAAFCTPVFADTLAPFAKERFQIRVRAIDVIPQESSTLNIAGDVRASNQVTPEVDLSYFFTDHISAEVIAATSKHTIKHSSGAKLGTSWALPPTVTMQYHFTPQKAFSPYVGAGLNYTVFYNDKAAAGFTNLNMHGGMGYAVQAGADYWLGKHWGINFDVKKIFLNTDATLNDKTIRADVDLDPWVVGAGVSYRF